MEATFVHTGFESPIAEFAILLLGHKDGHYQSFGSGVIIGPHLAMTARHVIDDYLSWYEGHRAPLTTSTDVTFSLQAIHFLDKGTKAWAWDVRKIHCGDPNWTDLVFLELHPTVEEQRTYVWRRLRMRLLPPAVGSSIAAFGYHSSSVEIDVDKRLIVTSTNPYTTTGVVEQIYERRRDSVLAPFPCFQTNARFDRAMSGGPVFNEAGHLVGLISLNMPPATSDASHISHVATLWPSMGIMVTIDRENYPRGLTYPAYELATGGFIEVVDLDNVRVTPNENGGFRICALHSADSA